MIQPFTSKIQQLLESSGEEDALKGAVAACPTLLKSNDKLLGTEDNKKHVLDAFESLLDRSSTTIGTGLQQKLKNVFL